MPSFAPSSPVTGATVPLLTNPTYTLVQDTSPVLNVTQYYVSALGGTQTNVSAHSASKPFTLAMYRPTTFKLTPAISPVTGMVIGTVPYNRFALIGRKGVLFAANQLPRPMVIRVLIDVPAGSDSYDTQEVEACISMLAGALFGSSSNITTCIINNTV